MTEKVRLNLQVSQELNSVLEDLASKTSSTRSDVIRQALSLMRVAFQARVDGRHLGLVRDPTRLDTEIIGLL